MKASNFLTMSAVMALMFGGVMMIEASVTSSGFYLGLLLFIYFIAVILLKGMWGMAGKLDNVLTGGKNE